MVQMTDSTPLVLLMGAGSVDFGAVNQLAKWGMETLKGRAGNGNGNGAGGGVAVGDRAEFMVLLKQTHGLAIATDRRLENLSTVLEGKLGILISQGEKQIDATRDIVEKIEERSSRRE